MPDNWWRFWLKSVFSKLGFVLWKGCQLIFVSTNPFNFFFCQLCFDCTSTFEDKSIHFMVKNLSLPSYKLVTDIFHAKQNCLSSLSHKTIDVSNKTISSCQNHYKASLTTWELSLTTKEISYIMYKRPPKMMFTCPFILSNFSYKLLPIIIIKTSTKPYIRFDTTK